MYSSVFCGLLGLGGALCLHFPALLTLPDARAHYPMGIIRLLIQGLIAAAFVLAAMSAVMRQRKILALTGGLLAAAAALLGGGSTPLPNEIGSHYGIGFDWFLLDLLVMTLVFVPVERFWPLHPKQKTFRPEWTTDAFYFVTDSRSLMRVMIHAESRPQMDCRLKTLRKRMAIASCDSGDRAVDRPTPCQHSIR